MHIRSHRQSGHAPTADLRRRREAPLPDAANVAEDADARAEIDPEVRYRMISEAAYHLYEARGFGDGYDVDDWLAAEAGVDRLIASRRTEGDGDERLA